MDRGIANDGKFLNAGRDKDQNAVPVARFRHAKFFKLRFGRRDRIDHILSADEDPDFTGGFLLGLSDGGDDVAVLQLFHK